MPRKSKEEYNAYMREYQKARYERRRAMFIEELGGVCVECGLSDNLEFDHINPETKSFNVAKKMANGAEAVLREEIAKCQLLCQSCHKKKSIAGKEVGHGEGLTGKKNCRCDLCKPLKNEHSRITMQKRRASASDA
jgi:5-methylcytosine-specific restriction endonuclease McrA